MLHMLILVYKWIDAKCRLGWISWHLVNSCAPPINLQHFIAFKWQLDTSTKTPYAWCKNGRDCTLACQQEATSCVWMRMTNDCDIWISMGHTCCETKCSCTFKFIVDTKMHGQEAEGCRIPLVEFVVPCFQQSLGSTSANNWTQRDPQCLQGCPSKLHQLLTRSFCGPGWGQ